jgi:putative nucleotidyltransferase with HDIG domain
MADKRRYMDELKTFSEAGKAVISILELDELFELITEKVVGIMKVEVCSLRLLDDEKENLVLKASYGHSNGYVRKKKILRVGKCITGKTLKTKKPLVVEDVRKDPKYSYPSLARKDGLVSLLAVPLIRRGEVIGVINVYKQKRSVFRKREITILSMFADHAAIAIENARLLERIRQNYLNTVKTLGAIIDAKDDYTRGHSEAVVKYAMWISEKMGLSPAENDTIRYAAFLHDIGKIGINVSILNKTEPLTQEEWSTIVKHPVIGSDIVKQLGFLDDLVPVILHHHERYDGHGYPNGLKDDEIPVGARILGIADAYDAMTSDRPYRRRAYSRRKAVQELKKGAGTQFDPEIVEKFIEVLKGKE